MERQFKYGLEKGSKKHFCPQCDKKRFVRYINLETNEYLPLEFGRCDRESKCGYFVNPYSTGYIKETDQNNEAYNYQSRIPVKHKYEDIRKPIKRVYFDFETFKKTLQGYKQNTFINNLLKIESFAVTPLDIEKVISLYRLGTITKGVKPGAITFPFIDTLGNVRTIQVKQFDKHNNTTATGFLHRDIVKHLKGKNKALPDWLNAYLKQGQYVTCMFGDHLLNKYPTAMVYLFEAPKTAIYSTLFHGHPEISNIINLAVYNKSSYSFDKAKVLKGRFVRVFPDLSKDGSTFAEWEAKSKEYQKRLPNTNFITSDLLERNATKEDRENGLDYADYLTRLEKPKTPPQLPPITPKHQREVKPRQIRAIKDVKTSKKERQTIDLFKSKGIEEPEKKPNSWSDEITDLEKHFASIEMPKHPVKLNGCGTITDCGTFVFKHLAMIKKNNGNKTFLPYLDRLRSLKQILNL